MSLTKGYIQIYTGNGKGKMTAALGQALRAAGSGLKTFIVTILIPLLALKRFSSTCQAGLVMAAFNLGVIMAPIWGSVADRYGIQRGLFMESGKSFYHYLLR